MRRAACAVALFACVLLATGLRNARAASVTAIQPLHLNLIEPNLVSSGGRVSLDVSFRGGPVTAVELYLDGSLSAQRTLRGTHSRDVITFVIDTTLMSEGTHSVLVKAQAANGTTAEVVGKITVPAIDLSSPVRISYPKNGSQVSGTIPIEVHVDSSLRKPYVTFFVDDHWNVVRNYPPYVYNWDTTQVANGWHTLAVTAFDDSEVMTKAAPIRVMVNNPGGLTKEEKTIPDLRKSEPVSTTYPTKAPTAPVSKPVHQTVKPVQPRVQESLPVTKSKASAPKVTVRVPKAVKTPNVRGTASVTLPNAQPRLLTGGFKASVSPIEPRRMGSAVERPAFQIAQATLPHAVLPALQSEMGTISPIFVSRTSNRADTTKPHSRYERRIAELPHRYQHSATEAAAGAFQVVFDNSVIAFDVPPRIEGGIRLAPFRQIFEHTGGQLYWFNHTKTVHAVNATRDIEITIGHSNAIVNNTDIRMKMRPYIDHGRTIVPISFIRDALNAVVHFDPKTGRVLIESVQNR